MENQKEPKAENQKQKTKRKTTKEIADKVKKGKIAEVARLHQKGLAVKAIAEKMQITERTVRSYVWREKNRKKYQALLARYLAKRKQKILEKQKRSSKENVTK